MDSELSAISLMLFPDTIVLMPVSDEESMAFFIAAAIVDESEPSFQLAVMFEPFSLNVAELFAAALSSAVKTEYSIWPLL